MKTTSEGNRGVIAAMMVSTKAVVVVTGLSKTNNKAKPCNSRYGLVMGLITVVIRTAMASTINKTKAEKQSQESWPITGVMEAVIASTENKIKASNWSRAL